MALSNFLGNLNSLDDWAGCSNTGIFNIETGYASFRSEWLAECDCTIDRNGSLQYDCSKCHKSINNNLTVPTGDGDGLYSVVTFHNKKGETFASATLFDTGSTLAQLMISEIQNGTIRDFDSLKELFKEDYHGVLLGELDLNLNLLFCSDASGGKDSSMATVWSDNWVSGSASAYAFVEDSKKSANAQAAIMLGAPKTDFNGGLESSLRIKMVVLISDAYKKVQKGVDDLQFDHEDWKDQIIAWKNQKVIGHVGSANEVAIYWNGRLENCFATYAAQNELGTEMDYAFKEFSWYLQGATFGIAACEELMTEMVEESDGELEETDLLKSAYAFRGLMEKAESI